MEFTLTLYSGFSLCSENESYFMPLCDLTGYGEAMVNPNHPKTYQLAGFSERLFDLISLAEGGPDAMVKDLETIEI